MATLYVYKSYTATPGLIYNIDHYDTIIDYDVDVFKEDNKVLVKFRKNVLSCDIANTACDALLAHSKRKAYNRGFATGMFADGKIRIKNNKHSQAKSSRSNIIGYFDKAYIQIQKYFQTNNVCRITSFNKHQANKFQQALPLIYAINNLYHTLALAEYNKQRDFINNLSHNMFINNTVFTTITTNYNFQTACHIDKGDFGDGLSALIVIGDEKWSGCYIGFPEYKIAFNLRKGDILLMDSHEYHCNTELIENEGYRLSLVCYARSNMSLCKLKKIINNDEYWYKP